MRVAKSVISILLIIVSVSIVSAIEKPLVLIPYRGSGEKCAKGIFFDHAVMRKMKVDTKVVVRNNNEMEVYEKQLSQYLKENPVGLPCCDHDVECNGVKIPSVVTIDELQNAINVQLCGLLFLPGWQGECLEDRKELDQFLITNALNRGQPILAVCAGCWNLMHFGSEFLLKTQINREAVTVQVTGHSANKMVSISGNNGHIINNTPIHAVQVHTDNLLLNVIPNGQYNVNSIHKEAVNREFINEGCWNVWATSVGDSTCRNRDGSVKHDRHNNEINSQGNVVEAFECTKYGIPIIGVQWHAEAYAEQKSNKQENNISNDLVKFMINAGTKYKTVNELKEKFAMH